MKNINRFRKKKDEDKENETNKKRSCFDRSFNGRISLESINFLFLPAGSAHHEA